MFELTQPVIIPDTTNDLLSPHVASSQDPLQKAEFYLNYANLVWDKVRLQRETTDRYFNYYLLLITTPIIAFAAIFGKEGARGFDVQLLGAICLFLFVIGVCFFCLYIRQRVNNIALGEELTGLCHKIEDLQLMTGGKKHHGLIFNGVMSRKGFLSGDFWVSMIQTMINSFWLINALRLLDIGLPSSQVLPFVWGMVCISIHFLGRDLRLYRNEKRFPFLLTICVFGFFNLRWKRAQLYRLKKIRAAEIKKANRKKATVYEGI
ncbi:MAG: hypothetical protein EOO04_02205 [Chitinophagaceae bacterium]|nr:MAG: hypothetical protein EOO04_02205 [Chitinophagaceae bacterium]